jgi:hypothetical protein
MILAAITDYDLGYTLEEAAARLKKKAHRRVSPSTIASWLEEYKQHCSYRRLRAAGLKRHPATQTIRTIKRFKAHKTRACHFLRTLSRQSAHLFVHWRFGPTGTFA